jgi:hypothetical protein
MIPKNKKQRPRVIKPEPLPLLGIRGTERRLRNNLTLSLTQFLSKITKGLHQALGFSESASRASDKLFSFFENN